ncbi:DUF2812 domain-containing protein [Clostridium malenominatum]|uniref:DUF2812 domain-containing protein n=1 Tax=Clostridium malenominatum TaxID=1539 RepID=A0ABN1IS50_9CLOT
MKKFKVFVDMNEEEKYLNEMAKGGHILKKYSAFGRYHFQEGMPQDLRYRIDYRVFNNKSDFQDYVTLFEDAGWKHVYGTRYSGSQYFLPLSKQPSEDIFSDKESKAKRHERLRENCMNSVAIMIIYFIIVLISINFNLSNLFFLTPGLWGMQGAQFWKAFWFEFPFMLMRVVPQIIFIMMAVIYGVWASKAKKVYEESMKK